jgi:NADP-dependent 3-hydroxy acid dehydrogenase YdfG
MSQNEKRTVWVTGATSGIGRACVVKLVGRDHRVIALGRRLDRLQNLQASLQAHEVHVAVCDVQNLEQVRRTLHELPPEFAAVDTLINNAGLMLGTATFEETAPDAMSTMVMTNCMGVLHNTSVLLPALRASGRGHIVNVTSIAAHYPYITGHVYAATKAFVEHFGANLRTEIASEGVRVTNVAPGRSNTEFQRVRAGAQTTAHGEGVCQLEAEDVAEAICWALDQPKHANVNAIELVPARQSLSFR